MLFSALKTQHAMSKISRLLFCLLLVFCTAYAPPRMLAQNMLTVEASRDNTLIESATGAFSNGAGPFLFAGRVDTTGDLLLRRALLYFDLTALPLLPEQITSVSLVLYVSRPEAGSIETFTLHPALQAWGEGTSSSSGGIGDIAATNDATWVHTFHAAQFWDNPGGDFTAVPSATFELGPKGSYTVSSQELLADVQQWLAAPDLNHGWMLRGTEDPRVTVKRIASREQADPSLRPHLIISYSGELLPVSFTNFEGIADGGSVFLKWATASELNNAGFDVQVARAEGDYVSVGFVSGHGTTNEPQKYSYALHQLDAGQHHFRLKQIDFDGSFAFSEEVVLTVGNTGRDIAVEVYPNPTNNHWQVVVDVQETQVLQVAVYDMLGRRVLQVFDGYLDPGKHTLNVNANALASNVYLVRVRGEKNLQHKQVVLEK